jgi:hypothetical protein
VNRWTAHLVRAAANRTPVTVDGHTPATLVGITVHRGERARIQWANGTRGTVALHRITLPEQDTP